MSVQEAAVKSFECTGGRGKSKLQQTALRVRYVGANVCLMLRAGTTELKAWPGILSSEKEERKISVLKQRSGKHRGSSELKKCLGPGKLLL